MADRSAVLLTRLNLQEIAQKPPLFVSSVVRNLVQNSGFISPAKMQPPPTGTKLQSKSLESECIGVRP